MRHERPCETDGTVTTVPAMPRDRLGVYWVTAQLIAEQSLKFPSAPTEDEPPSVDLTPRALPLISVGPRRKYRILKHAHDRHGSAPVAHEVLVFDDGRTARPAWGADPQLRVKD
jgi:hypothetical protein